MNEKIIGAIIGIAIVLSIAGFIGVSTAQTDDAVDAVDNTDSVNSGGTCSSLSIGDIDKNNDGICSSCGCGKSVSTCISGGCGG